MIKKKLRTTPNPTEHMGRFLCQNCGAEIVAPPGPHITCPRCQGAYLKWVNYENFRRGK